MNPTTNFASKEGPIDISRDTPYEDWILIIMQTKHSTLYTAIIESMAGLISSAVNLCAYY